MVADSLRRGEPASPLRRRSTKFRRKATGEVATSASGAAGPKRHSIASGELHLDGDGDGEDGERPGAGRLRSLSATLGEAFGKAKKGKVGAGVGERRESLVESAEEEEAGPSGRS